MTRIFFSGINPSNGGTLLFSNCSTAKGEKEPFPPFLTMNWGLSTKFVSELSECIPRERKANCNKWAELLSWMDIVI